MKDIELLKPIQADVLKKTADEFNSLSDYEKFLNRESNIKMLNNLMEQCERSAKTGSAGICQFLTYRYDDPDKEHLVKFFTELGYMVKIEENGKPFISDDYVNAPYRCYKLFINWNVR